MEKEPISTAGGGFANGSVISQLESRTRGSTIPPITPDTGEKVAKFTCACSARLLPCVSYGDWPAPWPENEPALPVTAVTDHGRGAASCALMQLQ